MQLGIDLGSQAIKLVVLDKNDQIIYKSEQRHRGAVLAVLISMLEACAQSFPDVEQYSTLTSGIYAKLLTDKIPVAENEAEVQIAGVKQIYPSARSIIEIGGQSSRYIDGFDSGLLQLSMNEGCSAGTGSFFEAQMNRLGLSIEDYSNKVADASFAPNIAGRCSVFSKTDITHLQQEGIPMADILLGLCYAVVRNYRAVVIGRKNIEKPVVLSGGTTRNSGVIRALIDVLHLSEEDFLVSELSPFIGAIGTAILAGDRGKSYRISELKSIITNLLEKKTVKKNFLPPLQAVEPLESQHQLYPYNGNTAYTLGLDIGSTTTKLVLINNENNVVTYHYMRTKGDPQKAVDEGLSLLLSKYGNNLKLKAVGITGSGRVQIGKRLKANTVRDEITAQAACALHFTPEADTIFEIGGQDAKFIRIANGMVTDFQMNKICAAGTGSFVEEQAELLGINLSEYGDIAIKAESPVNLGERCTVFMESNISSELSKGTPMQDIAAGICYSVVKNYLSKVVSNKEVGKHILLQGGVAYNSGIVAAFRSVFGSRLHVAPYFSVSGAIGAAILAKNDISEDEETSRHLSEIYSHYKGITANFEEPNKKKSSIEEGIKSSYEKEKAVTNKKTIGIPLALFNHSLAPILLSFFQHLDYHVVCSDESTVETVEQGQLYSVPEVCFPLKLAIGHAAQLVQHGIDYLFMPSVLTLMGARKTCNYACVYMQKSPQIMYECLKLEEKNVILLAPELDFSSGYLSVVKALIQTGVDLGHKKTLCRKAAFKSIYSMFNVSKKHRMQVKQRDIKPIHELLDNEIGFVIISRGYALSDPVLSLNIANRLQQMGQNVYNMSHLIMHKVKRKYKVEDEYSDMNWPFGQHTMLAAQIIRNTPKLYAIYLTYHGCGPDGMLSHMFESEMQGKPFLAIEVDEHSSDVGLITRIEAFVNSVQSLHLQQGFVVKKPTTTHLYASLKKDLHIALPTLYPYSNLLASFLKGKGYDANMMPSTTLDTLEQGLLHTSGKEYFSLTAMLGDVICYSKNHPSAKIVLPQLDSAEADAQYARVIQKTLGKLGLPSEIATLTYKQLTQTKGSLEIAMSTALAGDILLSASLERHNHLFQTMIESFSHGLPNDETLADWAREVEPDEKNIILIVGEVWCLYNPLFQDALARIDTQGLSFRFAPLSEQILFSLAEQQERASLIGKKITEAEQNIQIVAKMLGSHTFSPSILELRNAADNILGNYTGGNGRYRIAKAQPQLCGTSDISGLIQISSLYENTSTVLSVLEKPILPTLQINFNGSFTHADEIRFKSFIQHFQKKGGE